MDHHGHMGHNMHTSQAPSMGHAGHGGHGDMPMPMPDDGGDDMGGMMSMTFHFGCMETILFSQWKTSTVGGLIGSMIGIFFMAALYEGLKYYREFLFWKTYNALQYRAVKIPEKGVVAEDNQIVQPTMTSPMHFYQTFLHVIQMILSYFLMLIFMTFNVWLCLAVILGACVGYFLFGWKKSVIVDVTEHCH